jgi:hypothetical protein
MDGDSLICKKYKMHDSDGTIWLQNVQSSRVEDLQDDPKYLMSIIILLYLGSSNVQYLSSSFMSCHALQLHVQFQHWTLICY